MSLKEWYESKSFLYKTIPRSHDFNEPSQIVKDAWNFQQETIDKQQRVIEKLVKAISNELERCGGTIPVLKNVLSDKDVKEFIKIEVE